MRSHQIGDLVRFWTPDGVLSGLAKLHDVETFVSSDGQVTRYYTVRLTSPEGHLNVRTKKVQAV